MPRPRRGPPRLASAAGHRLTAGRRPPTASSLHAPGGSGRRGRSSSEGYDATDATVRLPRSPAPFPPRSGRGTARRDAPTIAPCSTWPSCPQGAMRRVTVGELDVLLAHTRTGIYATDDRCPHMAAPLSIGELDGCIVACPLHEGRFDLEQRGPGADADDRRPRPRWRLPPDLVVGRPGRQDRPARQEGRGPPAHPRPSASATTRCGSWTARSRSRCRGLRPAAGRCRGSRGVPRLGRRCAVAAHGRTGEVLDPDRRTEPDQATRMVRKRRPAAGTRWGAVPAACSPPHGTRVRWARMRTPSSWPSMASPGGDAAEDGGTPRCPPAMPPTYA